MNRVAIILDEQGGFQYAYADSEVSVEILRRGANESVNRKIDLVEQELEEVIISNESTTTEDKTGWSIRNTIP